MSLFYIQVLLPTFLLRKVGEVKGEKPLSPFANGETSLVALRRARNSSCEILLVVDELCFVAPAVELANLLANLFGRMLSSSLTHRIEVNLTAGVGHIE